MSDRVDTTRVTRIEVIDHRHGAGPARCFVAYGCAVTLSVQDDGRTLKVFVDDGPPQRYP